MCISSKQKGTILENRIAELITLGSDGKLTCYTPFADDDGIDLIIKEKGKFNTLYVQVKSRFVLNKGRFIQDIGTNTFQSDRNSVIVFVFYDDVALDVETLWAIPSEDFKDKALLKAAGETHKETYRFSAGPNSDKDKWCSFKVEKSDLGQWFIDHLKNT